MKLSYSFVILAILTILCILIGFFVSHTYISSVMQQTAAARAQNNEKAVSAAIKSASELQVLFARDYSFWDDMVTGIANKDIEWISQEFFGPLEIYKSNAVWVTDEVGSILYQQVSKNNPINNHIQQLPFSTDSLKTFANQSQVATFFQMNQAGELVAYHIGPVLYHTRPDLNTQPYGYVIIAVVWDERILDQIAQLAQATISVFPGSYVEQEDNVYAQFVNYSLPGFSAETAAVVKVSFKDNSIELLSMLLKNQMQQTALLGLFGLVLSLGFFKFAIIRPIHKLLRKLESLSGSQTQKILGKHSSEMTALSKLIDAYSIQSEKVKEKNKELLQAEHEIEKTLQELKKSETRTKRQLQTSLKLAKAVAGSTDAIVITDADKKIEYVNPAWEQLNGYAMHEVIGKNPRLLKSNFTPSSVYKHLWGHLLRGESYSNEQLINQRKDGSMYAAKISVFPVIENEKTINYVGICEDISERKERDRLKSEFISLASHQLRTPLTSLRWLSELLRKSTRHLLPSKDLELLKDIEQSSIRMTGLVNRLLNLSRIETGRLMIRPRQISLTNFIKQLRHEILPLVKKHKLTFSVHSERSSDYITVDAELLHEILVNLLSNSCKYSHPQGSIILSITKVRDSIYFTLEDTGIGIPEKELPHIFGRFFRASNALDAQYTGTGLGLYLVKSLIEALDGEITIESTMGVGTKITFFVPKKGVEKEGEVGIRSTSL